MAFTYSKLAEVTVGATAVASIDFNSIPQNYTDLVIKYSARSSAAGATGTVISLSFNGSTSNFSSRYIEGAGSGTPGSYTSPANFAGVSNTTAMTASTFCSGEIYIPNYSGSTNKSYSIDSVTEQNTTGALQEFIAGLWSNPTAISQITLSTSNFQQYSTATLYGVKAEV
jgi:hypothetical protein